jgi:hypothetical protein
MSAIEAVLATHRDRLLESPDDDAAPERRAAVESLLLALREHDDANALDPLRATGELGEWRAFLGPYVLGYTAWTERRTRERLLQEARLGTGLGARLAAEPYGAYARVADGLALLGGSRCRSAVMVGCGPLPDTLVHLHEHTSAARIVGVDNDREAVALARELVEAAGMGDRVSIEHGDAAARDYGDADLIVVSVFATPRRAVLGRIAASGQAGASVLLREPFGAAALLFEPVLPHLPAGLSVAATAPRRSGPFMLDYHALTLSPAGAATASRNDRSMKSDGSAST